MKRQDYLPTEIESKIENGSGRHHYEIYLYRDAEGNPCLTAFRGSRSVKPKKQYVFKVKNAEEVRDSYVEKIKKDWDYYIEDQKRSEERYAKEFEEFRKKLEVGTIFSYSWGYDQTNYQFYQVTKIKGKTGSTVELRELKQNTGAEDGFMTALTEPIPNEFKGAAFDKRLVKGRPYLSMDFGIARVWDGEKKRYSWYA